MKVSSYRPNRLPFCRSKTSATTLAIVYLGLGDKEEALRWLEKSYQDRAGIDITTIKVDPFLDPLRGDPRFEELVAKVFAPKNGSSP